MRRTLALVSLLAFAGPLAAAQDSWIHVEVKDRDHRGTTVRVNLPVSALLRALPLMPEVRGGRCRFVVGDARITPAEMRRMWLQIEAAPEGTVVRHDGEDVIIDAERSAGVVRFRVREHFDQQSVDVTMSEPVVRALASSEAAQGLAGALRALAEQGGGEILMVHEDDTNVRVWVDRGPPGTEE